MNDQDWKQKYLDSLDKHEASEREWQATEALFRQGLTRVALAAQGLDNQLDKDLSRLRNVIRAGIDRSQLETVIDDLSRSVTRLDEQRSGKARITSPQELLSRWLDSLTIPAELKKPLKSIRTNISENTELLELETPLRELATLLNSAMTTGISDKPRSEGLVSRLFGNSRQSEHKETPAATATVAPVTDNSVQLGEFCMQLLDSLSLPESLTAQAEQLKDKLARGVDQQAITPTLNALAGLITAMRGQMENENRELQEFLRQLTGHLQDIDQHLAGAKDHQQASRDSGRILDAAVTARVSEIETTVDAVQEPGLLRQEIQSRLEAIREHLDQYRHSEEQNQHQLEARLKQLDERVRNMESEGDQLRERLRQKHELAMRDPLTGLYNRLAYDERMMQEFARAKRYQKPLVLMVIDVDHFKAVNDHYGHKAGDKALILIAGQLNKNLRETDFLARFGGEEFVVVMPETDLDSAAVAAEKLREAVAKCQFHYQGTSVGITVSAGLTQLTEQDSAESLFQRADQAMYQAKQGGRNRCVSARA